MNVTDRDGVTFGLYLDRCERHYISNVLDVGDSIQNYIDETDDEDEEENIFPSDQLDQTLPPRRNLP